MQLPTIIPIQSPKHTDYFIFAWKEKMAHKKAAWSAKNLRDSNPKYRGIKLFGWQTATAWAAIVKQKGKKYEVGTNTFMGTDYTIHAKVPGVVTFTKKKKMRFDGRKYLKTYVHIVPSTETA